MRRLIFPLNEAIAENTGGKAGNLAVLIKNKFFVPDGLCISKQGYFDFVHETGIFAGISMELGRKPFEDMRWEEMWDASLRIRNMFIKAPLPETMRNDILCQIRNFFSGKPVAVRSSSLSEDGINSSFAGLHESFINISDEEEIIKSIKLVWASLWSDVAFLYRKELSLSLDESAMGVIIQEMVCGEKSGVAFCMDPNDASQCVIESVYGLNKGLVDGDVEPDRFFLDRKNGDTVSFSESKVRRETVPAKNGVRIEDRVAKSGLSLNENERSLIYSAIMKIENLFGNPQDVEWTIKNKNLYILQSRPITIKPVGEKGWYVSLKRTLDNLRKLCIRVEKEILPQMHNEAVELSKVNFDELSDEELAKEVELRQNLYNSWTAVYWDECIPFAHAVRLFAKVYNDNVKPDNPYEFLELIMPDSLKSIDRNSLIKNASEYIKKYPDSFDVSENIFDESLNKILDSIIERMGAIFESLDDNLKNKKILILNIIKNYQHDSHQNSNLVSARTKKEKIDSYLRCFDPADQKFAQDLLNIAGTSYKLRDDDNIYLGNIKAQVLKAVEEAKLRLSKRYDENVAVDNIEELITALKFKGYKPKPKTIEEVSREREVVRARQLRGQPASQGIAKGKARVIYDISDLFKVEKGEILVCDSIDPNMTFVIPVVSAIVERRGGMLIHGAIIAREYGLPCVTGISKATEYIQTGDVLTVDGFFGLIINHTGTFKGAE